MGSNISEYARNQYKLVCDSRLVLFEFCSSLSSDDFLKETESMGRGGSVRNLLVHNANTYLGWIAQNALKQKNIMVNPSLYTAIEDVTRLFAQVNEFMGAFFDSIIENNVETIHFIINGRNETATPLQLFTHVITHEFHHKGQILSRCRQLGYVPVDTDILRF